MNAEKEEKHAPFFSNSSKASEKAPSGSNIRRSKRLGSRVSFIPVLFCNLFIKSPTSLDFCQESSLNVFSRRIDN